MIVSKNAEIQGRRITSVEGKPAQGSVVVKPMMTGDQMTLLEIHYGPNSGPGQHVHQHESVVYVVRGRVRMKMGEEEYILTAGDVCRHPRGVPHTVEALEESVTVEIKSPAQPIEQFLGIAEK